MQRTATKGGSLGFRVLRVTAIPGNRPGTRMQGTKRRGESLGTRVRGAGMRGKYPSTSERSDPIDIRVNWTWCSNAE